MTPDNVMQWAKALAILGGVLVGIYAVFSPSYVWYKRQLFGWGGGVLCGFGTILIVASIFHNVTFVANIKGLELRLAELQAKIEETKQLAANTNQELARVATIGNSEFSRAEFAKLQKEIEQLGFKVTEISSTSAAALTGLRDINAKIQMLPAVERDQNQGKVQRLPFDQPVDKPQFAPAR